MSFTNHIKKFALQYIIVVLSIALYLVREFFNLGMPYALLILNIAIIVITLIKEMTGQKEVDEHYAEARFTSERIIEIETYVNHERESFIEKQQVISMLIRQGLVDEKDVIANLKQKSFVSLFCYQRRLPDELKDLYGKQRPVLAAIEKTGFKRLGRMHNFYVMPVSYLPDQLHDINKLEAYLKLRIRREWKKLMDKAEKEDPKLYKKHKDDKELFNFSYFITKSFFPNLAIGFINYCCFNRQFVEEYSKFVKLSKIKVNKSKVSEFIKMLTIDLLTTDIPSTDREKINERKLRQKLSIKAFTDYANIPTDSLQVILEKKFDEEKAKLYATHISSKAKTYAEILRELGVI